MAQGRFLTWNLRWKQARDAMAAAQAEQEAAAKAAGALNGFERFEVEV